MPGAPPLYLAGAGLFDAASSPPMPAQPSVVFALSNDGAVLRFEGDDLSTPKLCASLPAGEPVDLAVGPSQLVVSTAPPDFGTGRLFASDLACDTWTEVFTVQEGQLYPDYEPGYGLWTLIARSVSGATSLWTSPSPDKGWVRLAQQASPFLVTHAVGPSTLIVGSAGALVRVDFTDAGSTADPLAGPVFVTGITGKPDGGLSLASIDPQNGTTRVTDYELGVGTRGAVDTFEDAFVTDIVDVDGKLWLVGAPSTYLDGANVLRATREARGLARMPILDCGGVAGWKELDSAGTHIRAQWLPGARGDWQRAGQDARMSEAVPIAGPFPLGAKSLLWGALLGENGNQPRLVGELVPQHRILFDEIAVKGPRLSNSILDIWLRSATPLAGEVPAWHFDFERGKASDAIRVTEEGAVRVARPPDLGESLSVVDPYFASRVMFLETSRARPMLRTSLDDGGKWSDEEAKIESRPVETAVSAGGEPVWRDVDGRLCDLSHCVELPVRRLLQALHSDGRTTLVLQTVDGVHWRDSIDGEAHALAAGAASAVFVFKNIVVTVAPSGEWREVRIE